MMLKPLNNFSAKKSRPKITAQTRILVFGTFDGLHKGHMDFFRQARRLAIHPFLIVSVARAQNVKKIKGAKPQLSERQRLLAVKMTPLVNTAVLGAATNYLDHIVKLRPAIIALGYDQVAYTKGLKQKLKALGLTVTLKRLKAFKAHVYKSSLLKKGLWKAN